MSYSTWIYYGYGICLDAISEEEIDFNHLLNLVKTAPKLYADIKVYFKTIGKKLETVEDILDTYVEDCTDQGFGGLATILKEIICENEGLYLCACNDYNNMWYLLYLPQYPWYYQNAATEKERELTEEELKRIINKYLKFVTDKEIVFDYQEVENGG
jgi:hypothetical protein